jgi:hypothetical protein
LLLPVSNRTAITTTNPSLLLPFNQDDPAITMTNHTNSKLQLIVEYLLLPCSFEHPAITTTVNTRNLLPFFAQNDPAITIASSLQLIVESLTLLCNEDNSETMAPSLLLFCIKDAPAIMTAPLANFSLQLIVDIFCKISFHFCEDYRMFCEGEYQYQDDNGHQELTELISCLVGLVSLFGFGLIGFIGLISLVGLGLISFIGQIGIVGKVGLVGIIVISFNGINRP